MACEYKDTGNSKDWIYIISARADSSVLKIRSEKLRSFIRVDIISAVETSKREVMKCMFKNLVQKTLFIVLATGYRADTDSIEDSFTLFVKGVVTEKMHPGVLIEVIKQNLPLGHDCTPLSRQLLKRSPIIHTLLRPSRP